MSFSSEVKEELAGLLPENTCCASAEAYGMLECGHAFSTSSVSLQTENSRVADTYQALVSSCCGMEAAAISRITRPSGLHILQVESAAWRTKILDHYGHSSGDVTHRLNRANLECDSCPAAYLRGAFLSCGAITNPSTDYHMEFSVPYYNLSRDIQALMRELGFEARLIRRKGDNIIYLKESEQIEDCLTLMGATNASLELMGVKMVKDIRNTANRITNCENANIDKTVAAALEQVKAIEKIQQRQGLDSLPEELRELAQLRIDNPDCSLRELGELLSEPLSRSGVNHRLKRILEWAGDR